MSVSTYEPRDPTSQPRRPAGRRLLGILIGLALLMPAAAGPVAQPLNAGGSCTGWDSRTKPPGTIRVGRADGSIDVVDFRRYVEVVTAKEWPSYIPTAAIEAGATAVKQYAWSKTLAGNHRPSYFNAAGKCYDVTDSTRDQLYRPEVANVTPAIRRAVDVTWGLTLKRNGSWFLTGYRTGTSRRCGADADGTRLYARSVIDCARRGLSRQQIQFRYYGRSLTLHWSDGRVISWSGTREAAASTSKPKSAPRPKPAPTPAPEPVTEPSFGYTLDVAAVTGEPAGEPSPASAWLPAATDAAAEAALVTMPTVYSLPGTLLTLPSLQEATESSTALLVCATSVGTLPVGEASFLELLPPPFGCADAAAYSAATGVRDADGAEPALALVYVDVERTWVIY